MTEVIASDLSYEDFQRIVSEKNSTITKDIRLETFFDRFKTWKVFAYKEKITLAIYGGNLSGCVAYSYLSQMNDIEISYIFDRSLPDPQLSHVRHKSLNLPDNKEKITVDVVFLATAPLHYPAIIETLGASVAAKHIYLFFAKQSLNNHINAQSPRKREPFSPGAEYIFKYIKPLPLFDPGKKIALLCSGKSGSTFAVKWFLFQVNMLDAAEFYSSWIHDFRTAVFYESKTYKTRIDEIFNPDILTIKFVRNPYHRAVSTYLNFCRANYHRICGAGVSASASMTLGELEQFLNRKFDSANSFSFVEFLHYIDHIDVENCDMHLMKQSANRAFENALKNLVILKLEDSIEQLPVIEKEYGLKQSNISTLRKSLHHANQDKINDGYCGDKMFQNNLGGRVPEYKNFYNQQGLELIQKIYEDDFTVYQYDTETI